MEKASNGEKHLNKTVFFLHIINSCLGNL